MLDNLSESGLVIREFDHENTSPFHPIPQQNNISQCLPLNIRSRANPPDKETPPFDESLSNKIPTRYSGEEKGRDDVPIRFSFGISTGMSVLSVTLHVLAVWLLLL